MIAKRPMLHTNFMALSSIEPALLPIKVLHGGNREFRILCSCDIHPNPMPFIYKLDLYPLKMYP